MTCKKQGNCLSEPLFFVEKYSRQQLIWRLYFFISFIIFLYVGCFASESLPVVVEWHEYECQQGVPAENLHCARHSVSFAGHRQNGQIPSVPAVKLARLLCCVFEWQVSESPSARRSASLPS